MALLTQKNVGGQTVNPATATLSEAKVKYSSSYFTPSLSTSGLPRIQFWARIYGIPVEGVPTPSSSANVQFQVATRTINGEPDFRTFYYISIPPTNGTHFNFEFPCLAIRALIAPPVFGTNTYIDYSLNAFGP